MTRVTEPEKKDKPDVAEKWVERIAQIYYSKRGVWIDESTASILGVCVREIQAQARAEALAEAALVCLRCERW